MAELWNFPETAPHPTVGVYEKITPNQLLVCVEILPKLVSACRGLYTASTVVLGKYVAFFIRSEKREAGEGGGGGKIDEYATPCPEKKLRPPMFFSDDHRKCTFVLCCVCTVGASLS